MRSPFVGGVPSPAPLERAGTVPSRAGPHFSGEMGERAPGDLKLVLRVGSGRTVPRTVRPLDPVGERVSFPHTPFLWTVVEAAWFFNQRTWPAASKTNASWPAHQLGRAGEVIHRREENTGTRTVTLCLLPKGTYPRPQPAQPVGGPLRAFQCEGRRPGIPSEVQPPPTQPHQKGRTSSLWGSFPHFFPRNGAPAGQAKVPCRSNGGRKERLPHRRDPPTPPPDSKAPG